VKKLEQKQHDITGNWATWNY